MKVNGTDLNIDDLIKNVYDSNDMIKDRGNGIYLTNNQISVLNRYDIDYKKYNSIKSLIFEIETVLNECDDAADLDEVSRSLSEINYYNNTNK